MLRPVAETTLRRTPAAGHHRGPPSAHWKSQQTSSTSLQPPDLHASTLNHRLMSGARGREAPNALVGPWDWTCGASVPELRGNQPGAQIAGYAAIRDPNLTGSARLVPRRGLVQRDALLTKELDLDHTHPGAVASVREGLEEAHRAVPGRLADPGSRAALHEQHRVDDLPRPHPLGEREQLAERHLGTALMRRQDDRGRHADPPRQRPPASPGALPARMYRRNRRHYASG